MPKSRKSLSLRKVALMLVGFILCYAPRALPQSPSAFPVDITLQTAIRPVMVAANLQLVYELRITSFAPWPVTLSRLEISGSEHQKLAEYDSAAIAHMLVPAEHILLPADSGTQACTISPGHTSVLFIDLDLNTAKLSSRQLLHRFFFLTVGNDGTHRTRMVDLLPVPMEQEPLSSVGPPLTGATWIAFNAFGGTGHRRSFNPVDGRLRIAERFAIDWMKIGPDGKLYKNDGKANADYYGYGAPILAIANARVVSVRDGLPDQTGLSDRESRAVTLENVVGNYITLKLENGKYALYAHLQPGSLKVKPGDLVTTGQVIAKLGNSGNSDEPHLHFQMMDANSPLGSEGIPYVIKNFTLLDVMKNSDILDLGQAWQPGKAALAQKTKNEFPLDNAIVSFP